MLITSVTPLSPCTTGTSPQLFHDLRNFALRMLGCNLGLKCAHSQAERCTAGTGRKVVANVSETAKGTVAESSKNRRGYTDVQGAPRFPIKLPVALKSAVTGSEVTGSGIWGKSVETENISANGVLFRIDVVGAKADVQVDCRGRVVRSFEDGGRRGVGVVIDEYRFERR